MLNRSFSSDVDEDKEKDSKKKKIKGPSHEWQLINKPKPIWLHMPEKITKEDCASFGTPDFSLPAGLQLQAEMEKSVAAAVINENVRNHIPDDLAFSIMSKLPLKSLKRFGCVHKSWAFLFENPHFISIFRNNFISNNHSYYDDTSFLMHYHNESIFIEGRVNISLISLSGERFENRVKLDWPNPFQQDDPCFLILGSTSISGTLCLYILHERHIRVFLWNPAIGEFKVIPISPAVESVPPHKDSLVSFHGFGYDRVRDDYRVIQYVFNYRLWEIYSLRSDSWRKLDVDMPTHTGQNQLYMDGMCHWWCASYTHNTHDDKPELVSFDLSNEVFFTTPMPIYIPSDMDYDSFKINFVCRLLVLLNGSIALISYYTGTTTFHISILGELGVKESWTTLFVVGPLPCVKYPIGAGKKGDIFFRKKDDSVALFDLNTQMIEELGFEGEFFFIR